MMELTGAAPFFIHLQRSVFMKFNLLALLVLMAFFASCEAVGVTEPEPAPGITLAAAGDSVITNKDADLYDRPNGAVLGVVADSTAGLTLRVRSGWASVDFESGQVGVVQESDIDVLGSDPPDDPPTDPPSGNHALIFGCSNFSNLADGVNSFSSVLTSNGASPGNRGKTIITYGEASSGSAGVFDHVRQDLTPDVSMVIAGLCHRYDYKGEGRPGARAADVPYFLPADSSGSALYGELELIRRMAINTRELLNSEGHASTPLYMLALHDYDPAGSCERVGVHNPAMLRAGIAQLVAEGLVSEMAIGGEPFKLLPLVQPGETTAEGCHISEAGKQKLVTGAGGLDDWASQ